MTFEEEIATLQQFLRFGETKSIVELMALQDKEGQAVIVPTARANSDIRSFIESNMHRPTAPPSNSESLNRSNGHHFETLVNSMAFMLPLQLLNSVPAPLLSSRVDSSQQEAPVRHETLEPNSDNSTNFISDHEREEIHVERAPTKSECEDFTISDNYSSPSTPCTPSISSDVTQMSPESKIRAGEKGTLLKKGRVFCSACEKTFYDKGTLKIHYNAVHLKIKHKCTIEGCNMVFSSLRSRNRHSANPNPRLHMPMNRNNRDKDLRGGLSGGEEGSPQAEKRDYGSADSSRSISGYLSSEPKLNSFPSVSVSHSGILFPNLKTVQPVLPFYRSLVTPAELANTPGNLPSLPLLSSSVSVSVGETGSTEPVPKKKSRKSSMPIKIEKDELAEGSGSDEDERLPTSTDGRMEYIIKTDLDERGIVPQTILTQSLHTERAAEAKQHESITACLSPFSSSQRVTHCLSNRETQQPEDQTNPETDCEDNGLACKTEEDAENCRDNLKAVCADSGEDLHIVTCEDDEEELLHHCESCNKTFKNPYSVKMHYRSVHLKEMHMCTIAGCNAAFPSRRSRDR